MEKADVIHAKKNKELKVHSTVKSEIQSPDGKGITGKGPSAFDKEDGSNDREPAKIKSQIVKVSHNSKGNVTSSNTLEEGKAEKTKRLRVVRKVGIKQPGAVEPVINQKPKERKPLEIYKPPGKSKHLFYWLLILKVN